MKVSLFEQVPYRYIIAGFPVGLNPYRLAFLQVVAVAETSATRSTLRRLHRIQVPTLIVWGREDALVPVAYAKEFGGRIAGSQVEPGTPGPDEVTAWCGVARKR